MSDAKSRAVFLDRDGTLIEDLGYPREPERVRLLDGVVEGLSQLRDAGFRLVLISNQSGIGRGIVTVDEARSVHERLIDELAQHGLRLDAVRYCPHAPWEHCECRKPAPDMLLSAAEELGIDLPNSFMIGDKPSDVEAGRNAGCRTVLLGRDGDDSVEADHFVRDWRAVTSVILQTAGAR